MRILMVSYSDIRSGNATRILQLASRLKNGFTVDVLFDGSRDNAFPQTFASLNIRFTPWLFGLYPTLLAGMPVKVLQGFRKYNVIHCFKPLPSSFIPAWFLARLFGAKLVLDWDDWEGRGGFAEFDPKPLRGFLDWFQGFAVRHADVVACAAPFLEKEAIKRGKQTRLIPNGADVSQPPTPSPGEGKTFELLYVGHLYKSADLDLALHALAECTAPNIRLTVAGDGPRRREFELLAAELGVAHRVDFLGHRSRDEIPRLLREAHVVLLPMKDNLANRARSPVKLGEYLAAGKAVIASPVGISGSLLVDGKNALLASTPKEFGDKISLLAKNPALRKSLEQNARRLAEEKLDWSIVVAELEKIYAGTV